MTLDYIPDKYYPKLLENKGQLEEWAKLYSFDAGKESKVVKGKLPFQGRPEIEIMSEVLKQNPTLVLDTKFFDNDFKYQLLGEIDDLDEKTNGILINSENYQALNLLLNKYREKIKCCYIDPPYNTERDRELRKFIYKDGFNESSWLSMMEGRLILSRNILTNDSVIFTSIDDNELQNLRILFDNIFGFENRLDRGVFIWENKGSTKGFRRIVKNHEYIIAYSNNPEEVESVYGLNYPEEMIIDEIDERLQIKRSPKNPVDTIKFPKGLRIEDQVNIIFNDSIGNGTNKIDIISNDKKMIFQNGKLIHDVLLEASFPYKEQMLEFFSKIGTKEKTYDTKGQEWLEVYFTKTGVPYHRKLRKTRIASSLIQDVSNSGLKDLEKFGIFGFDNPKPVSLIQFLLKYFTSKEDIVLDYFAGSGTTGESVIITNKNDKNNRKFILVEMAEYFDTVLKPRILKVIYSDNWKDGIPLDNNGSKKQIIKYQTLEQYEDSLNNIDFTEPNIIAKESKDYKIKYMLEFESKGSKVLLNLDALDNPFEYKLKFEENNGLKENNIDLVETFNYLAGITVKSIKKMTNGTVTYVVVKGYHNEKDVIIIWRNKPSDFDPIKDKEFIEKEILKEDYDEVLVNGNSLVKGAKSIDEIFKANMFGGI
jgi:adenine-specific DNA-methyltransferase